MDPDRFCFVRMIVVKSDSKATSKGKVPVKLYPVIPLGAAVASERQIKNAQMYP